MVAISIALAWSAITAASVIALSAFGRAAATRAGEVDLTWFPLDGEPCTAAVHDLDTPPQVLIKRR
jgi:hypothetical protein